MNINNFANSKVNEIAEKIEFFHNWPSSANKEYTFNTSLGLLTIYVSVEKHPDGRILNAYWYPTNYTGGPKIEAEIEFLEVSGIFTRNYKFYTKAYKLEGCDELLIVEDGELRKCSIPEPEDHIVLSNGNVLMNKFGKYEPNLCFINTIPHLVWERNIPASKFNLDRGSFDALKGTFFVSKKGTKCFRIEANGPHILIKEDWGGAFCRDRGRNLPESQALYYRRATSNGGGMGCDYAVYPADWKYILSEEDV